MAAPSSSGFLNTLLIAFIGIMFATMIGFIVGIMRLSKNWLVARIATIYVETIRNIPLLLQLFIWYKLVLVPLPGPRQASILPIVFYLTNAGLIMPLPVYGAGGWMAIAGGLIVASLALSRLRRWARARQMATGQIFPHLSLELLMRYFARRLRPCCLPGGR